MLALGLFTLKNVTSTVTVGGPRQTKRTAPPHHFTALITTYHHPITGLSVSTMALLAHRSTTSSLIAKRPAAPALRLSNGGIRCRVASLDVAQPGRRTDERGFVLKEVRVVLKQGGAIAGLMQAADTRITKKARQRL